MSLTLASGSLPGKEMGRLSQYIKDHFTHETLSHALRIEMGVNLEAVAGGSNFSSVAFSLVDWANRAGRIPELVDACNAHMPAFPIEIR